jgi:hypothetical protein
MCPRIRRLGQYWYLHNYSKAPDAELRMDGHSSAVMKTVDSSDGAISAVTNSVEHISALSYYDSEGIVGSDS